MTNYPIAVKGWLPLQRMAGRLACLTLGATLLIAAALPAHAATRVAVAANLLPVMEQMVKAYAAQGGTAVEVLSGSTGMLYGQIRNGAPVDLFIAADTKHPDLLMQDGLAEAPAVVAVGRAVFWTAQAQCARPAWQDMLVCVGSGPIAIAQPDLAPYGAAADRALEAAGLGAIVRPRLVFGESVGKAFQFAASGSAVGGFVALSQAMSDAGGKGVYAILTESPGLPHAACVLRGGQDVAGARAFLRFLQSAAGVALLRAAGYEMVAP